MIPGFLLYKGGWRKLGRWQYGELYDREYTWLGHAWVFGPPRWFARGWNALPLVVLALILWRVWS